MLNHIPDGYPAKTTTEYFIPDRRPTDPGAVAVLPEREFIEIAKIQQKLMRKGWRWQEEIFADNPNTMVEITQDSHWDAFSYNYEHGPTRIYGWGRYPRLQAWRRAERFIDQWASIEEHRRAGAPTGD